ncbi:TetR/AcrR family transcriptional regulator [Sphingomonas radiodurans]|uniref:TetR/AcrR family transcriptional regulator n=1 Tax=Sphingomonas radiodurans TaxID=2890321 RepID=UPI001E60A0D4|nr:TetR/AcrR family transcriptional regulator [Sphingomonas radiodurans]WBH17003.1 TetR/AcrR family transcriptional regulator [Sphingomonas radiodurans]
MASRPYHHGDLRAALVEAGLAAIEARGADDLSLRELARVVGVSATAVYRHFPDKKALLAALASVGLEKLGETQRAASDAAGGGAAGFKATGIAYVRFALSNPGLFRLVYGHPLPKFAPGCDPADDAMAMLQANAAALAPDGVDPQIFALQSWSLVHGLAMLLLDQQITLDDAAIDRVVDLHVMLAETGSRT